MKIPRDKLGRFTDEPRPEMRRRVHVFCAVCCKGFDVRKYRVKIWNGKIAPICCSRSCANTLRFTGRKKAPHSIETKRKISETLRRNRLRPENYPQWKGDKVGYYALHDWVYKELGRPQICISCGKEDGLQWANKTGGYKRRKWDWISLCYKCHIHYDRKIINK